MKRDLKYRAVLFDFDGTLTPSLPLWVRAYRIALRHFGIDMDDPEVIRRCLFKDWHAVAADLALPSGEAVRDQVDVGLREAFLDAALFPLVLPLIDHCRCHGLQTALVTSSPRSLLAAVLPKLGLISQFDFVVCGDDVKNYKPHPEPVLTTLQALQRLPHEAIMVGDATVDMLAGKAAGTATALFLPPGPSPFHSPAKLRATAPDHVFEHHRELPALLGLPDMLAPLLRPGR
jgi:phosphoglycolate phosphatase-like HAD superfamily hydrolase